MNDRQVPKMRSADAIQSAHDMLITLRDREIPVELSEDERAVATSLLIVLCWVLQHGDGNHVSSFLLNLQNRIHALGFRMHPFPPHEPRRKGQGPQKEGG